MLSRLLLCCSLLLVVFAAYQVPKDKAMVEGRVVSAATGEPLSKVSLLLKPSGSEGQAVSTESDNTGKFVFEAVSPGSYMLMGERTGYLQQAHGAKRNPLTGTPLALTTGAAVKDLIFRMNQPASISGRVLDKDGEPVLSGFLVLALKATYSRGKRQYALARISGLDAKGRYRIQNLPADEYLVLATTPTSQPAPAPQQTAGAPAQAFASTYYPNTVDQAAAVPLKIGFGMDVSGIDIRAVKSSTVSVKGRVVGVPEGRTPGLIIVPTVGFVGANGRTTRAAKDGTFEFRGVARGTYSLSGSILGLSRGEPDAGFGRAVVLEVGDRPIEDLVLPYFPHLDVSGRVVMEGDRVPPKGLRVSVESPDNTWGDSSSPVTEDGSFLLERLGPTSYLLRVEDLTDGGSWYVKSVRYGGRDATQDGVDLSCGISDKVEVTLSAAAAQVSGVVHNKDDKPVPGAIVTLIPKSERRSLYKTATADQNGAFRIRGIAPGDYRLLAWEDIEPGAEEDPEFVRPFSSRVEALSLKENDRNSITLEAIPAGQ